MNNPKKLNQETKKKVEIEFIGMGAMHDLECWLCNEESAVYNMNPNWVFEPCWKCQEKIGGKVYRVKSKILQFLINNFNAK